MTVPWRFLSQVAEIRAPSEEEDFAGKQRRPRIGSKEKSQHRCGGPAIRMEHLRRDRDVLGCPGGGSTRQSKIGNGGWPGNVRQEWKRIVPIFLPKSFVVAERHAILVVCHRANPGE